MKKNDSEMRVYGIETNNLKGINVSLEKRGINVIIGPSGSGKSSLAYDTIAQIGVHEYMSMFNDYAEDPSYKVKQYENMMVTVPIRQTNHNNNMRSSIGTYFGLSSSIISLFASFLDLDIQYFALNNEKNTCEFCHGRGYVDKLDENKIINYRKAIKDNPFRCWDRYSDFYSKILKKVCLENSIDAEKTFEDLSQKEREFLLYGESDNKYHITFKHNNSISSRTTKYYGALTNKAMLKDKQIPNTYYSKCICEACGGKKYSKEILSSKVCDISIGDFMNTPFERIEEMLEKFNRISVSENQKDIIANIRQFIEKANELFLGHLFFNRAIPTLSGGELQRLRLIQVFNSHLNNLAIILDEPLAGLSGEEKSRVYKNILKLAKDNSLVIVDHGEMFYNIAKKIIALGPGSGMLGGNIIDEEQYIRQQRECQITKSIKTCKVRRVEIKGDIFGFKGAEISFAEKGLTLVHGKSGIGKSTLLREYFPRIFDNYFYVDQKPAEGNVNSNVATLLGIANIISKKFASKYSMEPTCFSNSIGKEGACPRCSGRGFNIFGGMILGCKDCGGTGFKKELKQYSIYGKDIFQIYSMTISDAKQFFVNKEYKVYKKLEAAEGVLLGHLQLGQRTSTLSGGENIRIKLIQVEGKKAKIIGVDEPFKGLSKIEIYRIVGYLRRLRDKERTLIVVDHTEGIEESFEFLQNLTVDKRSYIVGG